MTQSTDITLSNQSGANYRTEHNSINQAFGSQHKGSTAPSYVVTGMGWIDDAATPWIYKVYDGTDWIGVYEINPSTNNITIINSKAADSRTEVPNVAQVQDGSFTWLGTSSGTNTITATASPAITAYVAGQRFRFIAGGTNTGAVTININSAGAKAIQLQGAALGANAIISGFTYEIVYDGTQFQILGLSGGAEGDILYFDANNRLTRLAAGTDGEVLTLASGIPSWASAVGLSYSESSELTVPTGGIVTWAHGLGAVPKLYGARLVCKTTDGGYAVGDELAFNQMYVSGGGSGNNCGANSTNVFVVNRSANLFVINKSGTTFANLTAANWRIVLWALN